MTIKEREIEVFVLKYREIRQMEVFIVNVAKIEVFIFNFRGERGFPIKIHRKSRCSY